MDDAFRSRCPTLERAAARGAMSGVLRLDAPYLVETGIGHLGSSSPRMIYRMPDPRSGAEVARLSHIGVNLDLDACHPARWPDDIRHRAAALVVPEG